MEYIKGYSTWNRTFKVDHMMTFKNKLALNSISGI